MRAALAEQRPGDLRQHPGRDAAGGERDQHARDERRAGHPGEHVHERGVDGEERRRLRHLLVPVQRDLEEPARVPLRERLEEEVARRAVRIADQPALGRGRPDQRCRGAEPEGDADRDEGCGGPQPHVRRRPSSSDVCGRQPSSRSARETSRTLRSTSPGRAGACVASASTPATRRQASKSSLTDVSVLGADVEDAAVAAGRREHRRDDVADVDVVARLLAVAEDRHALAGAQPVDEDRDDAALELRQLARPVDVREAERDVTRPVQAVPGREVLLGRELRGAVGRERPPLVVLPRGALALAVDRAAGGAEDQLRAVRARRLEHVHRPEHVHLRVEERLLDGGADVGLRGEVDDELGPELVEERAERLADVVLVHGRGRVQVLAPPGGEVVDDVHLVAARDERVDDVRADEARLLR